MQVVKKGFVTYDSTLELTPGQKANLKARMAREEVPLTKKWWFWGWCGGHCGGRGDRGLLPHSA